MILSKPQTPKSHRNQNSFRQDDVQVRVKQALEGTSGGVFGFEQALKSFSGKNSKVNQD